MVNISKWVVLCALSTMVTYASAQRELMRVDGDAASLLESLSATPNKIERVMLTKEDERSVTVSLRFAGYDDAEYQVQVSVLDMRKEQLEMIAPVRTAMPKSRQADVTINMTDSAKPLTSASVQTKYLSIRVTPKKGGVTDALEELFDDLNPSSTEYLFELNKKWMAMGAGVNLTAKLTPYKNAASISPN